MTPLRHGHSYQKRMKQDFVKKVRPREFKEGDLVQKKNHLFNQTRGANEWLIMKAHMLSRELFPVVQ